MGTTGLAISVWENPVHAGCKRGAHGVTRPTNHGLAMGLFEITINSGFRVECFSRPSSIFRPWFYQCPSVSIHPPQYCYGRVSGLRKVSLPFPSSFPSLSSVPESVFARGICGCRKNFVRISVIRVKAFVSSRLGCSIFRLHPMATK
jgi:hypothetical protein